MKRLTRRWNRRPRPQAEEKKCAASLGRARGSAAAR